MEEQDSKSETVLAEQEKPKGLLYHYTDLKGLMGILGAEKKPCIAEKKPCIAEKKPCIAEKKPCIRATHIRYLNDSSEFVLGWNTLREMSHENIRTGNYLHMEETIKVFSRIHEAFLDRPNLTTYFVCCFTVDGRDIVRPGDRLSQWRGYSKGNQVFSLGFDANRLSNSISSEQELIRLELKPCIYDKDIQDSMLKEIASKHCPKIIEAMNHAIIDGRNPNTPSQSTRQHFSDCLMDMYMEFFPSAAFFKHAGFQEEREWRYVFIAEDNEKCKFRESIYGLTPYIELDLDLNKTPSSLERIVVGPGPHKDEWVTTIQLLLAKCAISGVEVVPSQIPYRNW